MEEVNIYPPYWIVMYLDDYGQKHLATVKEEAYLKYLENRYTILDKKLMSAI